MVNSNLIYDIGMHLGQDTEFYLRSGYSVISVDAFPIMIENAKEKFGKYIKEEKLTLLNYAMTANDNEVVEFHISEKSEWNSLHKDISTRQQQKAESIHVPTVKLSSLFKKYGIPYYCKIDVEGYDDTCIKTLKELESIPKFISCETECFSENQIVTVEDILATLNSLQSVGYTKFKLIEQDDLNPLCNGKSFYKKNKRESLFIRGLRKILRSLNYRIQKIPNREILSFKNNYNFPFGATGPFGNDLQGEWMNYETAKETLLFHRKEFFSRKVDYPLYTIWCDWHATY
jgi:FkbM family methyltransferase